MESLNNKIRVQILSNPLILDIGFANIDQYKIIPGGRHPWDFYSDANIAIVYITLISKILETYGHWYVVSLINYLTKSNQYIKATLQNDFGIQSTGIVDEKLNQQLIGNISFRQFAVLSGLGSIGKNRSFIHHALGAGVCIGIVLAKLDVKFKNHFQKDNLCRDCNNCIKNCPTSAITVNSFNSYQCKNRRKILKKGCSTPCINLCTA